MGMCVDGHVYTWAYACMDMKINGTCTFYVLARIHELVWPL